MRRQVLDVGDLVGVRRPCRRERKGNLPGDALGTLLGVAADVSHRIPGEVPTRVASLPIGEVDPRRVDAHAVRVAAIVEGRGPILKEPRETLPEQAAPKVLLDCHRGAREAFRQDGGVDNEVLVAAARHNNQGRGTGGVDEGFREVLLEVAVDEQHRIRC